MLQGFATIAADRRLALITALGVVQTFTRGCLTVFTVVVAIDLLGTGDPGVGVLNAAVGAGGVLGSILAFGLVRRGGLAAWFGVGIALFGAPLVADRRRPRAGGGDRPARPRRHRQRADRRRRLHAAGPAGRRDRPGAHVRGLRGDPDARGRGRRPGRAAGHRAARRSRSRSWRSACSRRWPWPRAGPRCAGSTPRCACATRTSRSCARSACWARCRRRRSNSSAPALEHAEFAPGQTVFEQGEPRRLLLRRASPVGRRWSATGASSGRSAPATASARSRCCATSRGRPPSARPRTRTCA